MEAIQLMQCIIMEKHILIKLTHHDETKERAHDSQIVRAKENLKLSHGGPATDKFAEQKKRNKTKIFIQNTLISSGHGISTIRIFHKQEMSQSRDECPQRNWSSIRHVRGKLAVI